MRKETAECAQDENTLGVAGEAGNGSLLASESGDEADVLDGDFIGGAVINGKVQLVILGYLGGGIEMAKHD